jgi:glycosyltransferase involved in cell wall biosynthesis
MTTRRVALFLPGLDSGGVSRVMLNLAGGLAGQGFEVDLVLSRAQGVKDFKIPEGVNVAALTSFDRPGLWNRIILKLTGLQYFADSLSGLGALSRYLKRERPAVLLSGTANVVAVLARRLSGVRTRLLVTAAVQQSRHFGHEFTGLRRLLPILHDLIMKKADGVVAESEGVARDLIQTRVMPAPKIWVINNPVVTPELLRNSREETGDPWFMPGEPPVVLGAGRLEEQKDFATLIRAVDILRRERPVRLLILGEGRERPALESLVAALGLENDCRLPGYKPNPYSYLAASAVFVLSSAWEGFGNVVAEALAVGTPVVSTDCESGPREILEDGKHGRLVPVGDYQAMALAIRETLDRPPNKDALRQRGREFSLGSALPKFLSAFQLKAPADKP